MKISKDQLGLGKNTKILLVVAIVIVVLIIVVAAAAVSTENKHDGKYNYELSTIDSFVDQYNYTNTPGTGNVYVVAHIVIKNDNYSTGLSNNAMYFTLKSGGYAYSTTIDTFVYPGYSGITTVMPGYQVSNYFLFIVPLGFNMANAEIVTGMQLQDVVYDSSLTF